MTISTIMDTQRSAGPIRRLYGTANVTTFLRGVRFPIDKNELIRKVGHLRLENFEGEPIEVRELLELSNEERFLSPEHVAQTIEAADEVLLPGDERPKKSDRVTEFIQQQSKRNWLSTGLALGAAAYFGYRVFKKQDNLYSEGTERKTEGKSK